MISWPKDALPHIQMNHIDGPVLYLACGTMHWLTILERVQLHFGWTDAEKLQHKHWPFKEKK